MVFSPAGIVMAHILVNLPYAIRLIRTAFEASDQRMEFIALTLGASPWRCFLTILLPLCRRSLVSTFILTWSRALGSSEPPLCWWELPVLRRKPCPAASI